MKAMLLAAGKGERMLPLTLHTPKPLLQAGGKSLIRHHVEKLAHDGITDLVINHAWLGDQVEAALGDGARHGVSIAWSREGEPLETAGGIIQALPLLTASGAGSFIVINTDIWTDFPYATLPSLADDTLLAWLVLVDNPSHHPAGDFVITGDRVRAPATGEQALTFSGIAVYRPELFAGVSPGKRSVVPLLKAAMAKGRVGGQHYRGAWFDIGTPERLQALDAWLHAQEN